MQYLSSNGRLRDSWDCKGQNHRHTCTPPKPCISTNYNVLESCRTGARLKASCACTASDKRRDGTLDMTESTPTHTYTIQHRYATRRILGQYQLADVTFSTPLPDVDVRWLHERHDDTPLPRPRVHNTPRIYATGDRLYRRTVGACCGPCPAAT